MDFDYSPDEEAFRTQVRAFLDANLARERPREPGYLQDWLTKVRARRWVGFSWPADVGGGGAS